MIVDIIMGIIAIAVVFGGLLWKMIQEDKKR